MNKILFESNGILALVGLIETCKFRSVNQIEFRQTVFFTLPWHLIQLLKQDLLNNKEK